MTTWHYENGRWSETTFFEDAWQAADSVNCDAVLKILGYEHYTGIGDDNQNAFVLDVYRREEPPRFIVQFSDGNIWGVLTAATLPDALELLARYAPIVTASEVAGVISDIRNLESFGIVTDVLASADVNQAAAKDRAATERRDRQEARRAAQERERQLGRESP